MRVASQSRGSERECVKGEEMRSTVFITFRNRFLVYSIFSP